MRDLGLQEAVVRWNNAKLKKGRKYYVLCRPFRANGSWRKLTYRGYDRKNEKHKFESRITVKRSRLWKRVRGADELIIKAQG